MKPTSAQITNMLKLGEVETSLAVAGETVVWSKSIGMKSDCVHCLEYQASSDGDVNLTIEWEQGNTELTSSEEELTNADWAVPYGQVGLGEETLTDKNTHLVPFRPAATGWGRVKITGNSGNDASTVLSKLKLSVIYAG